MKSALLAGLLLLAAVRQSAAVSARLQNQAGEAAWSSIDVFDETKIGVAAGFIPINPGVFEMGSSSDQEFRLADEVQHTVKLTKGYEMQAAEMTQLQYFLATGGNPSTFNKKEDCPSSYRQIRGQGLCPDHPVENISWENARRFAELLNRHQNVYRYRLPTEAEWEYAARAGTPAKFPYFFGYNRANELDQYAWYVRNSGRRTHPVATRKANPWGLYDLYGNVDEWVEDWYGPYPRSAVVDPKGYGEDGCHAMRGGSWALKSTHLRSAFRDGGNGMGPCGGYSGFRLVRTRR